MFQTLPCGDERFLREILGLVLPVQPREEKRAHGDLMAEHEIGKRGKVSGASGADPPGFIFGASVVFLHLSDGMLFRAPRFDTRKENISRSMSGGLRRMAGSLRKTSNPTSRHLDRIAQIQRQQMSLFQTPSFPSAPPQPGEEIPP